MPSGIDRSGARVDKSCTVKHDWMAVDGGPGATVCHMWCANCGTLWAVADMQDPSRTNRYFIAGWAPETDDAARPEGGFVVEPACPPKIGPAATAPPSSRG